MSSIDGLLSHGEKKVTRTKSVAMKKAPVKSATQRIQKKPVQTQPNRRLNNGATQIKVKTSSAETPEKTAQKREDFLEPVQSFDFDLSSEDIQEDLKKEKKEKKKGDKKKKKRCIILVSVFSVLAILLAVALIWGNDLIARITGGKSGIWDLAGLMSEQYVDLKTDSKGRTNILVFGTSGYDMSGSEGDGTHDGAQLTDSIMMVSLDQITGDIAMVSLPRDLKAGATCTATGKVNEVYWCANPNGDNEEAGATALMNKVTEIFGTEFQYYAHVDWAALTTVVDAIGGITVTLDEDIEDYYYTKTVIPAGVPTTLNGEEALGLARARHGTALGDFSRGNSQQKILMAIKDKVVSEGIDLTRATDLINAVGDNIRTNFSLEEVKTGVHLLSNIDLSSMRQVPILDWEQGINLMTTANIGGISYVVPTAGVGNYAEIQQYIAKMFDSDPAIREDPTVEILNGSEETGVAGAEQEKLTEANFIVEGIGDAPTSDFSGVSIYVINGAKVGSKKKLEEIYGVSAKGAEELPAGVAQNADFVIIIGNKE